MPHLFRVDRVRGCLLGMAVGDALGAPLEGLSSQQIRTHYGRVRNYVDGVQAWKRKPYRWRMRGLYSDDTQQALAICDVLLDYRRVDPERLADLYLALMTPKGFVRRGASRHRAEFSPGAGRARARSSRAPDRPADGGHRRGHADRSGPAVFRRRNRADV